MIRLGDARNYTRRDRRYTNRVAAINVDGLRSRPGEEFVRKFFEVLRDGVASSSATWHYHHDAVIDESLWLECGVIVDLDGNSYFDDGGRV